MPKKILLAFLVLALSVALNADAAAKVGYKVLYQIYGRHGRERSYLKPGDGCCR
jgi:hypothetical protein